MHTGTNSPAYPGALLWSQACGPARNSPCSRACTQTGMDAASHAGMEPPAKTTVRKARCPLGFSEMQIAILSLLKAQPPLMAYWQIAEVVTRLYGIGATEGAVRGALERLGRRGFLVRSRAAAGRAQGSRYAFSADPCPHITPPCVTEPGMEASTEPGAASDIKPAPSLLEEKRDRRNLSVFSGTRDARKKSAFEAWCASLSPEEKNVIVAPGNRAFPMPEDTALRQHFFHKVWPEILKTGPHFPAETPAQPREEAGEKY